MKTRNRSNLFKLPQLALALSTATAMAGTDDMKAPAPAPAATAPDWLKVSGYAAAAYTYDDASGETFLNGGSPFDATKVGFLATEGAFSGYASLFYTPGYDAVGGTQAGILDAYASYKTGEFTITAGKYLSYLGYEAFDTSNMTQITYANTLGAIPAYHSGVKVDYATDTFGAGLNVSDSIRGGTGFWTGDKDFGNGLGYEGYVTYKGIKSLTLWAGVGFEDAHAGPDFSTYDVWASYEISDKLTVAGEVAYNDNGPVTGVQGLAFLKYAFTKQFSTVLRFGTDQFDTGGTDTYKYTLAPTYAFTDNFLIRAELTATDGPVDSTFSGAQALLKF
jgi:hypothetical protein